MDQKYHLPDYHKKILLRPLAPADKASIAKYINNYRVVRNLRDFIPYPYSEDDAESFINLNKNIFPPVNFTIEFQGEAIGVIGLVLQKDIHKINAEIGYWIGEPFWGMGLMSSCVKLITEYAFKTFSLKRIYAGVFETNTASMRVLEKSGYTLECVIKKSLIKNEVILDEHLYSIRKS
ncbi:MAG: GNAT family N-acetyltransferase [Cytophagaceae bacterium]